MMNRDIERSSDYEYIRAIIDRDNIKAPESLSEDRIMEMLPDRSGDVSPETVTLPNVKTPSEQNAESGRVTAKASSRLPGFRKWAAAAACFLIAAVGVFGIRHALTAPPDTVTEDGQLYTFQNVTEIENLIGSIENSNSMIYGGDELELLEDSDISADSAVDSAAGSSSDTGSYIARSEAKSSDASGSTHSDTYLQVDNVDEADIVKTDGRFIYYVTDNREVVILSASDGKTMVLSKISASDKAENYIHDIFLKGDVLVTVGYVYEGDDSYAGVVTYDISDRSKPEQIAEFRQTGSIVSSRMVGDYIYLVTSDYVYKGGRCVPKVMTDGEFKEMPADSICCVPEPQQSSYIVLGAMDITSHKTTKASTRAVFGASDDIYCNDSRLYTAVNEWDRKAESNYTRIVRAELDGLKIRFSGTARVRGRINNQFSMDEKDGYLRIATTGERDGMDVNNLFILDSGLKETGSVTGFARNESIRAVRYFGDKAYVITYEQIDPLFIIDLSDPADPEIEGEVMIDGFSTLLVPAGNGRLLGIGHATGDNGYGGEYDAGLKLVLFDISDPSSPEVLDSMEFNDMESPATDTHKALTVNSSDGWYAIPYGVYTYNDEPEVSDDGPEDSDDDLIDDADEDGISSADEDVLVDDGSAGYEYEAGVLVFSADDGIKVVDRHRLGSEYLTRSVYIGDYIYALDGKGNVSSFRVR